MSTPNSEPIYHLAADRASGPACHRLYAQRAISVTDTRSILWGIVATLLLMTPVTADAKQLYQCRDKLGRETLSMTPCKREPVITEKDIARSNQLSNRAHEETLRGNYKRAREHLERAIVYHPQNAHALYNLGVVYERLGEWNAARKAYRDALKYEFKSEHASLEGASFVQSQNAETKGLTITDLILRNWNSRKRRTDSILNLTGDVERGREIYEAKCSIKCHQPEGWGLSDGSYPEIAGQHRTVQIKQLLDIRLGNRDNPTMFRFALPSEVGGEQAIADVSAYIETLDMTRHNGKGPGINLVEGKAVYKKYCARCHGDNGEGNAYDFSPRIQGQHYNYLVRQYRWIRDNKRRNAHPLKMIQIDHLNDFDVEAVMDYVSRMLPPKEMLSDKKPGAPRKDAADDLLDKGEGLF